MSQYTPHRSPKRPSRLLPALRNTWSAPSSTQPFAAVNALSGPLSDNDRVVPRRRRIGTVIACDRCRLKKIRCHGGKPTCYPCQRRGSLTCHYEDPSRNDPSAGLLLEATGLLNSMSPSQAHTALAAVRDSDRDWDIIAILRDRAGESGGLPNDTLEASSEFSQLLGRMHPLAYPDSEPINPIKPSDYLKQLVTQRIKNQDRRGKQDMLMKLNQAFEDDTQVMGDARLLTPAPGPQAPDHALEGLNIGRWTTVAVSNDFAASAISLYFTIDHPLLCPFDRKLFTEALVSGTQGPHCSASLVNALMYWCCLAYASFDPESSNVVDMFRKEAEHLTERELNPGIPLDAATEMFLSLGYLMQGRDDGTLKHLSKASHIGAQLGLFGVPEEYAHAALDGMTLEDIDAAAYPVWGVFNWTVFMHLFYWQKEGVYPKYPPVIPVPDRGSNVGKDDWDSAGGYNEACTDLVGETLGGQVIFTSLCHFWTILHEVATVYREHQTASTKEPVSLQFAEFKFRELLTWADKLPKVLARSQNIPDIVIVMHLWLHCAVLDIFRPFLRDKSKTTSRSKLRTFPAPDSTPDAAYNASVKQLKQLIIAYHSNHTSSKYTILWQTALLYTGNAMLRSADEDRLDYFLICLYSLQGLRRSFRVAEAVAQALLSMAIQQSDISSSLANEILGDLRSRAPAGEEVLIGGRSIRAPFPASLDTTVTDSKAATVEQLANQFDESCWINNYTNIFDTEA